MHHVLFLSCRAASFIGVIIADSSAGVYKQGHRRRYPLCCTCLSATLGITVSESPSGRSHQLRPPGQRGYGQIVHELETSHEARMRPIDRVLERLEGVEAHNGYFMALCPAHDDQDPSLSLREGD